jgi:hypothetical protein
VSKIFSFGYLLTPLDRTAYRRLADIQNPCQSNGAHFEAPWLDPNHPCYGSNHRRSVQGAFPRQCLFHFIQLHGQQPAKYRVQVGSGLKITVRANPKAISHVITAFWIIKGHLHEGFEGDWTFPFDLRSDDLLKPALIHFA